MNTNDGGAAFSVPTERNEEGMTLRDYFAAKAMQEIIGMLLGGAEQLDSTHSQTAIDAYKFADAMLEARNK